MAYKSFRYNYFFMHTEIDENVICHYLLEWWHWLELQPNQNRFSPHFQWSPVVLYRTCWGHWQPFKMLLCHWTIILSNLSSSLLCLWSPKDQFYNYYHYKIWSFLYYCYWYYCYWYLDILTTFNLRQEHHITSEILFICIQMQVLFFSSKKLLSLI